MKRFFRFLFRLLIVAVVVAAFILLIGLFVQFQTMTEQVGALSTRVHQLEQAGPARLADGRAEQNADTHAHADRHARRAGRRFTGGRAEQDAHAHADTDTDRHAFGPLFHRQQRLGQRAHRARR